MGDTPMSQVEQDIAASATLELTATIKGHVDRVRDTSKTTTCLATLQTQSAALHSTPPASRTPHWSATHTTPRLSDSACPLVAQVWCLDWSPCGQIMATSGADKKLMIWAEQGGSFVCQVRLPRIQKSPPTQ